MWQSNGPARGQQFLNFYQHALFKGWRNNPPVEKFQLGFIMGELMFCDGAAILLEGLFLRPLKE
jgi:hypothetical protein